MARSMLIPPYQFFGGKRAIADLIWKGLGDVDNYIEPFMGSLAVLLKNPNKPKIETVNDLNSLICNFWRAVANDPDGVAEYADYPVIENELHARQIYCQEAITEEFLKKMETDVTYYDSKLAGYWVYGMSASIGNNWMQSKGLNSLPILGSMGQGIHGRRFKALEWLKALQERTRLVRVTCGDWKRIVTPSVMYGSKSLPPYAMTAVFLDPPYADVKNNVHGDNGVFEETAAWAIENGNHKNLRIALCGYEGTFAVPTDWQTYSWTTSGGYAALGNGDGKVNATRERIWFSPNCLKVPSSNK